MGRCLVALAPDEIVEWSTVVDAPVSYILTADQARAEFGAERVGRALRDGTSMKDPRLSLSDVLETNRAGQGERNASLAEIRAEYQFPKAEGSNQ